MSINKMLIDATHPEETRVVVLRENRVEEFDYESAARKLLRGSIYLAKITRVEPSLQAAFVDYGGNRHGFLAFAEIHPDYYQIPHADKLALLEQETREQAEYDAELDQDDEAADPDIAGADATDDGTLAASDDSADPQDAAADDYDFEANAIDVTEFLPDAEATSDSPDGTANDARPDDASADQDASPAAAEIDAPAISNDDNASNNEEAAPAPSDTARPPAAPLAATSSASDVLHAEADAHVHITADTSSEVSSADDQETDDDGDDVDVDDTVESLNEIADDDDETIVALDEDDDDDSDDEDVPEANGRSRNRRPARQARPRRRARHYKIQEVIKRRQIVLIQVVKEERGNKGAALTTYLSLAGRYTVLMPNTARGGGISRKITNMQDRKRLKAIAQELEVPEGMGLIIRTAGAARTKQEIKRDFEYLLRLWENVRNLTLESTAPCLVYEEGNLIKRSIRDLYTKEIDEVVVAGEHAHKEAKGFMRMLMPSHAKNVVKHEGTQSLFAKFRIEQQLNAMFSPNVQLKSGGYLVINQTEALVAIDVNSGKSTREFSIEETALNTNLEAAEELSRQLKLRDLAGLIVVDFIDMEEKRNNRAVERKLKDSLKADRARIQVGRISHFGLLEMSRQRLRTGVLEGSTTPCEHCQGSGIVRSVESVALGVLRGLEDALATGRSVSCVAHCASDVALYLLNQKRSFIQELEERYGVVVHVHASAKQQGANFAIEPLQDTAGLERPPARSDQTASSEPTASSTSRRTAANDDDGDSADAKPRRRRRRRGRRDDVKDDATASAEPTREIEQADNDDTPRDDTAEASDADGSEDRPKRSRRRGRRGGRRHRDQRGQDNQDVAEPGAEQPSLADDEAQNDRPPAVASSEKADEPVRNDEAAEASRAGSEDEVTSLTSDDKPLTTGTDETVAPTPVDAASNQDDKVDVAATSTTAPAAQTSVEPAAPEETTSEPAAVVANETSASGNTNGANANDPEGSDTQTSTDRTARSQPVASEPVIQRRVIGPNGADKPSEPEEVAPSADETDSSKPSRKGWWQRQFGA